MYINAYMEKVKNHKKIFTDPKEIYKNKWKWINYFWNNSPIHLEIWTGLWNFFSLINQKEPEYNYVWLEIKYKRLYNTAEKTLNKWWKNFIVIKDYWENIKSIFSQSEIEKTYIFFPDPWPKRRHEKHRLITLDFLNDLASITKEKWTCIFKTDSKEYFDNVLETINNNSTSWKIITSSYNYEEEISTFDTKVITEFESIFRWKRTKICYLEIQK